MEMHMAKLISGFCGAKQMSHCLPLDGTPVRRRLTPSILQLGGLKHCR